MNMQNNNLLESMHWAEALNKLQQEGYKIHCGGEMALDLLGWTHFARYNNDLWTTLFHYQPIQFPFWFNEWRECNPQIKVSIFDFSAICLPEPNINCFEIYNKFVNFYVSKLELAILELIQVQSLRDSYIYEEEREIIENPFFEELSILQVLLQNWVDIKTKRIFLYLAREGGLDWYGKLNLELITLGEGLIIATKEGDYPGGKFDKEYNLMITPLSDYQLLERGFLDENLGLL